MQIFLHLFSIAHNQVFSFFFLRGMLLETLFCLSTIPYYIIVKILNINFDVKELFFSHIFSESLFFSFIFSLDLVCSELYFLKVKLVFINFFSLQISEMEITSFLNEKNENLYIIKEYISL